MGYRKQLSFRTECLNIMYPNFKNKTRERSQTQIELIYQKSMQYRISQVKTPVEKREIVAETNPLFYVFGENRKVFKPYLTYEENFNVGID
jgi:hypothetical protein